MLCFEKYKMKGPFIFGSNDYIYQDCEKINRKHIIDIYKRNISKIKLINEFYDR